MSSTKGYQLDHPAWALLLAGIPLLVGFLGGQPYFVDDAYITFRYAENLARGYGFVYNSVPVLGTTAPFYCLLLTLLKVLGISMVSSALFLGVISSAAAAIIIWRLGIKTGRIDAGFLGALMLALFPDWWLDSKTGMETTLAGALVAGTFYLDIVGRGAASGAVTACLVLTRPDMGTLAILLFLKNVFLKNKRQALRFALGGVAVGLPWLIYAWATFGSPIPQSLPAKKLIHSFPWHLSFIHYLGFFTSVTEGPYLALISCLWIGGAYQIYRHWREGIVLALWPPLFLLGLSFTGVSPFFWYKIPLLPVYFFVAAIGFYAALEWGERKFGPARLLLRPALILYFVMGLYRAEPYIFNIEARQSLIRKEIIQKGMSEIMAKRTQELKRDPKNVRILVGETGIIGYELMDFIMLDSAGINSKAVYKIRNNDWIRLKTEHPEYDWRQQMEQSQEWVKEILRIYQPDFIATDIRYLHLTELVNDSDFHSHYRLLKTISDKDEGEFAIVERINSLSPDVAKAPPP